MKRSLKVFAAFAPLMAFVPTITVAQNAPVVAVLAFDNAAFGPGAKEFDGIGKGIMDLVITDLASNSKVRVVDRERVQNLLQEQNLTKSGAIDATTAVRVGKLFGACYSIYGTFIRNDKTGENVLTIHSTSNETGQIQNAQKVTNKGDDMMGLIADASAKFAAGMDLKSCVGTAGTRTGDASPAATTTPAATQQSTAQVPVTKDAPAAAAPKAAPAKANLYAKPLTADEKKKLTATKLDPRTMLIYSRALDAQDRKENAKAVALYQQVVAKYKDFQPAQERLTSLQKSGD